MLLQRDIIRVKCLHLISQIKHFALNDNSSNNITAFISYAWPQDATVRSELQHQLLQLVEDLKHGGITALLDIMQLRPGSDVKQFMEQEIAKSHTVLWIGTPDLKSRIKFEDDGTPATNVAIEFCHIKNKAASCSPSPPPPPYVSPAPAPPFTVQSLHFLGRLPIAFPDRFGDMDTIYHDFTNPRNYYLKLPLLVASIYGIININRNTPHFLLSSPSPVSGSGSFISSDSYFWQIYDKYCKNVHLWEQSFSPIAIKTRLQLDTEEAAKKQNEVEANLQSLIANIPSSYIKDQQNAEEIKIQQLLSALVELKHNCLSNDLPHSQALEYYIPLRGEPQLDSRSTDQFEAYDKISSFLASNNTENTMILFGSAGAGKSLFARFVEQSLWKAWEGEQSMLRVPIFISLPQYFSSSIAFSNTNNNHSLIDRVLNNLNFTLMSDIITLKTKVNFLFILDGFDEVSLELLPPVNFLHATQISEWLDCNNLTTPNKVLVMCRTQQVPIIEFKIGVSIQQYFAHSLSSSPLESFYLMPFNTTQQKLFLQAYSQSPEARLSNNWTAQDYEDHINDIQGLATLVQTPFLLKLVANILPQLASKHQVQNNIKKC